jgi:hypothetical protein
MFDSIIIERRPGHTGANIPANARIVGEEIGGAELRAVYTGTNDAVREYLKRLEVGVEQGRLNCFIYALRMAGVDSEICDKMNSRCHGRYLQIKHIALLCDEFGLNVEVKRWRDASHPEVVVKAPRPKESKLTIGLFARHYFIEERSPFTDVDLGVRLRFNKSDPYQPLPLTSSLLLMQLFESAQMRPMYASELPDEIVPAEVTDLSYSTKHCGQYHPTQYGSSEIALNFAVFASECLDEVPAVSGHVKAFISKSIHGGRGLQRPGRYSDVSLLDVNSLYPAALAQLELPTTDPLVWDESIDLSTAAYYVVAVDITSFDPCWYYPMIAAGQRIVDKHELEDLVTHCHIRYTILRGYYFVGRTVNCRQYINELYERKCSASTDDERTAAKLALNSLFGYCLLHNRRNRKLKRFANTEQFTQYLMKRWGRVAEYDIKNMTCCLDKCLDTTFNGCIVGVAILSMSRRIMN